MDELIELNVLALEKALQLYSDGSDPSCKASVSSCVKSIREAVLRFKSEAAGIRAGKRGADKAAGKASQSKGGSTNNTARRPANSSATGTSTSTPQLSVTHMAHVDYLNRITSHLKESSPARPPKQLVFLDTQQQRQLSLQDNLHYVNSLFKNAKDEITTKSNIAGQGGSMIGGDTGVDSIEEKGNDTTVSMDAPDDDEPGLGDSPERGSDNDSTRSFSPELFSATSGQPIFSASGEPLEDFWIQGGTTLAALSSLAQGELDVGAAKSAAAPAAGRGAVQGDASFVQKERPRGEHLRSNCYDELADAFEMPP